jgi:hypothetical protein
MKYPFQQRNRGSCAPPAEADLNPIRARAKAQGFGSNLPYCS